MPSTRFRARLELRVDFARGSKESQVDRDTTTPEDVMRQPDERILEMLGPSWASMAPRQRELYPNLPADELDALWGMTGNGVSDE